METHGASRPAGFTLIEAIVAVVVIGVLAAVLLPAVQAAREAARRIQCANHLKQIAIAAHQFESAYHTFPPGKSPYPAEASSLVLVLPFLEQGQLYSSFNFADSVTNSPANFTSRTSQVAAFLCPSDRSSGAYAEIDPNSSNSRVMGRSNYFGNLGSHAWAYEATAAYVKDPALAGMFCYDRPARLEGVVDGTSHTALFSEIRRGARPLDNATDASVISPKSWGSANPATNPANLSPGPFCDAAPQKINYTGLQFQYGFLLTSFYNHTSPPNAPRRDCIRFLTLDQAHVASRSCHPEGVNTVAADGSVRFVSDRVNPTVWRAYGTRCGGEAAWDVGR